MLVKTSADAFCEFITIVTLDVGASTKAMLLQKTQYCGMVLVNQVKHLSIKLLKCGFFHSPSNKIHFSRGVVSDTANLI